MKTKILYTIVALSFLWVNTNAHGVDVSNVSVTGNDITFDISWKNSWNAASNAGPSANPNYPNNKSGVWVFLKVQNDVTNEWSHQKVSTVAANHSAAVLGPIGIYPSNDGIGVMLHHTGYSHSTTSFNTTLTLQMDAVPIGNLNFKVFAIEMVSSSDGAFKFGDGVQPVGPTLSRLDTVTVVSSNPAIAANALVAPYSPPGTSHSAICCNYPTGFWATNCMRYECTNEQFVEFLNTLTYDQQKELIEVAPDAAAGTLAFTFATASNGNKVIKIKTPGVNNTQAAEFACDYDGDGAYNDLDDGQNQAFGLSNIQRTLAYLDWSGLRPMTELEFEKFCRGTSPISQGATNPRIPYEFAWGTDSITGVHISQGINLGRTNERYVGPTNCGRAVSTAHHGFIGTDLGPMRVGQLAGPGTGRIASGSSFYGIMDLSGNVSELCVSVFYNPSVPQFLRSTYGDGEIGTINNVDLGDHNVVGWPSSVADTSFVTRGGTFHEGYLTTTSPISYLQTSTRRTNAYIYKKPQLSYSYGLGIRGVRGTD